MGVIKVQKDGSIVSIILNRPEKRNALNNEMRRQIIATLSSIDHTTRVILLTGIGKAFCAGLDLKENPNAETVEAFWTLLKCIYEHKCIVIAANNGIAVGGGLMLANICDIVIGKKSSRYGMPNVDLDAHPDLASPLASLASHKNGDDWTSIKGVLIDTQEAMRRNILQMEIVDVDFYNESMAFAKQTAKIDRDLLIKTKMEVNKIPFELHKNSGLPLGKSNRAVYELVYNLYKNP